MQTDEYLGTLGPERLLALFHDRRERMAEQLDLGSTAWRAFRSPDPTCNPYLSFSAQLLAGLDGVINKIEPPAPIDRDIYEMSAEEKAGIDGTPGSLEEALDALEADPDFLYRGDVFTKDVVEGWLDFKRAGAKEVQLRPHPYEFYLYSEM